MHGRVGYVRGCRCKACLAAYARYKRMQRLARENGCGNPTVSAERSRRHLNMLSDFGVGRRSVAAVTGMNDNWLWRIATGRKLKVRRKTEACVLSVSVEDGLAVQSWTDAGASWLLLKQLLREGFTKKDLARRLGMKAPSLQFRKTKMAVRNVRKVAEFYQVIMVGGE